MAKTVKHDNLMLVNSLTDYTVRFQVQLCDATNNDLEKFKFGAMGLGKKREAKKTRSDGEIEWMALHCVSE